MGLQQAESAHPVAVAEGFEGAEGLVGSVPSVHADAVARLAEIQAALAEVLAAIPVGLLSDSEAVKALSSVEAIGRMAIVVSGDSPAKSVVFSSFQ